MKIDTNFDYKRLLNKAGKFLAKNNIVVTSVIILGVGVFVLQRINTITNPKLDQKHLNKQLSDLQTVTFDQESIEKIEALENSKVDITSDFEDRDNPFSDN